MNNIMMPNRITYLQIKLLKMNKELKAGTNAQQSTEAEVPTSSQPCSNTFVSSIPQRSIKFRAWYKKGFGERMKYDLTPNTFHNQFPSNAEQCMVLMQFTGLQDKNGVDIYEGDIVKQEKWIKVGEYSPAIGIVKYKMVKFTCECIGDWLGSNADLNGNAEVIGNVFQNPEILG